MSTTTRILHGFGLLRRTQVRRAAEALPLSKDPVRRAIEVAFVERIAQDRRTDADKLAIDIGRMVDELDSGMVDSVIAANAPEMEPIGADRFDDVVPFSVERWATRRTPRR